MSSERPNQCPASPGCAAALLAKEHEATPPSAGSTLSAPNYLALDHFPASPQSSSSSPGCSLGGLRPDGSPPSSPLSSAYICDPDPNCTASWGKDRENQAYEAAWHSEEQAGHMARCLKQQPQVRGSFPARGRPRPHMELMHWMANKEDKASLREWIMSRPPCIHWEDSGFSFFLADREFADRTTELHPELRDSGNSITFRDPGGGPPQKGC